MKIKIVLIGFATLVAGVIPILDYFNIIKSPFPTSGAIYSFIVLGIGVIDLIYESLAVVELLPSEHKEALLMSLLTIAIGILPFIKSSLPSAIPTEGLLFFLMIAIVGLAHFVYGITRFSV